MAKKDVQCTGFNFTSITSTNVKFYYVAMLILSTKKSEFPLEISNVGSQLCENLKNYLFLVKLPQKSPFRIYPDD